MRAFVRGNWPLWVDYGLDSDTFAELSITVEGIPPLTLQLNAAKRAHVTATIPGTFGNNPRVARISLRAFTRNGAAANLRLYAIGMGEKGVQAVVRGITLPESGVPMAAADYLVKGFTLHYSSSGVGEVNGQTNRSQSQIVVDTAVLKSRQTPRKYITFSYTFHSSFSNGRWEIWKESGLTCYLVWHKRTGSISPSQTKSEKWDGRVQQRKTFSIGTHAILMTAWHGKQSDLSWAIIRTDPTLVVIE